MLRRIGTTLAVFHSADSDVQSHVAPLRRLPEYSVICRVQSRAFDDEVGATLPGFVLWELAPGRRPNWRRLHAVAQGARVVSYSADTTAMVMERSRRFGFSSHLTAPLRPIEVAHQVAIGAPGDLAIRWRTARSSLIRFLGRLDTVNQLVRDAAERLDPVEVAEALVHRAAAWLPGTRWAMVAPDDAVAARLLAGWRLAAPLHPVACALGLQAMKSEEPHGVADLSDDRRYVAGPAAAALAIPLRCRGSVVGALVSLDEAPSARRPEVSTGIATLPDSVKLVDRLLATADEAMYWIKNNGKNGVRLAAAAVGSVIKEESSR